MTDEEAARLTGLVTDCVALLLHVKVRTSPASPLLMLGCGGVRAVLHIVYGWLSLPFVAVAGMR
jgi:hypothetical protein